MATTSTPFAQQAERVHAQLLDVSRRQKALTAELAYLLADVERHALYRAYGRSSGGDYAVHFGIEGAAARHRSLPPFGTRACASRRLSDHALAGPRPRSRGHGEEPGGLARR